MRAKDRKRKFSVFSITFGPVVNSEGIYYKAPFSIIRRVISRDVQRTACRLGEVDYL